MSTAFHARTDGGIEGKHRVINMAMTTLVDTKQSNWVECIPHVQFRLNCMESATTGFTLFELVMGYVPMVFPIVDEMPLDTPENVQQYLSKQTQICRNADDAITMACVKQTEFENCSRTETPTYQPRDKVLLSTMDLNIKAQGDYEGARKWMHRWTGPFSVKQQRGTTVELELPPGWGIIHTRFHFKNCVPITESRVVMMNRLRNLTLKALTFTKSRTSSITIRTERQNVSNGV